MSYRNITVDGVDYKYTVGKSHVKVRGLGVWPKNLLGEKVIRVFGCDCGCYPDEDIVYTDSELEDISKEKGFTPEHNIRVRPEHIAAKIRETVRLNT
jgi:hypothetical protein